MTVLLICAAIVACSYRFTLREKEAAAKQSLFVKPDKQILVLGLIAFCCMVCEGAMADWSGVYFQKVVNAPVAFIPLGYIAFTCTMAGGRFLSDRLTTRYGVRPVLLTSGVLIATGLTLAILLPNLVSATTGMLLVGFGVSSVVPIAFGIAGRSTAMLPSTAIAAVSSISFLGFLVGPPLVGFLAQASSLKVSFMVLALLGLAISLIARKGSERLFR
jgi:MFS family permease